MCVRARAPLTHTIRTISKICTQFFIHICQRLSDILSEFNISQLVVCFSVLFRDAAMPLPIRLIRSPRIDFRVHRTHSFNPLKRFFCLCRQYILFAVLLLLVLLRSFAFVFSISLYFIRSVFYQCVMLRLRLALLGGRKGDPLR